MLSNLSKVIQLKAKLGFPHRGDPKSRTEPHCLLPANSPPPALMSVGWQAVHHLFPQLTCSLPEPSLLTSDPEGCPEWSLSKAVCIQLSVPRQISGHWISQSVDSQQLAAAHEQQPAGDVLEGQVKPHHWNVFRMGRGQGSTLPMQKTLEVRVRSLGQEDPLEKEMASHSSILAWEISLTEEHGGF